MLLRPERCQPEQPRVLVRLRVHREQLGSLDVDPSEDSVQRLRPQPVWDRWGFAETTSDWRTSEIPACQRLTSTA